MVRFKSVVAVLGAVGGALAVAPTAFAEGALPGVSVVGVGETAVAQTASQAEANAAYRAAMAVAIADGAEKAAFLAGRVGGTLGRATAVGEAGAGISCTSGPNSYAEYLGKQPDTAGSVGGGFAVAPAAGVNGGPPSPTPAHGAPKRRKAKGHRHTHARRAQAVSCTLRAQVSLTYALA